MQGEAKAQEEGVGSAHAAFPGDAGRYSKLRAFSGRSHPRSTAASLPSTSIFTKSASIFGDVANTAVVGLAAYPAPNFFPTAVAGLGPAGLALVVVGVMSGVQIQLRRRRATPL